MPLKTLSSWCYLLIFWRNPISRWFLTWHIGKFRILISNMYTNLGRCLTELEDPYIKSEDPKFSRTCVFLQESVSAQFAPKQRFIQRQLSELSHRMTSAKLLVVCTKIHPVLKDTHFRSLSRDIVYQRKKNRNLVQDLCSPPWRPKFEWQRSGWSPAKVYRTWFEIRVIDSTKDRPQGIIRDVTRMFPSVNLVIDTWMGLLLRFEFSLWFTHFRKYR